VQLVQESDGPEGVVVASDLQLCVGSEIRLSRMAWGCCRNCDNLWLYAIGTCWAVKMVPISEERSITEHHTIYQQARSLNVFLCDSPE
jgi:hypothetical protein